MDVKGALTVTGLTTLTSARGATGGTGADAQLVIDKAAIFTGGVVLEDGASPGKSMIEFEENNAVTITGVINGAAAGEGLLDITGTGKTFASAIGSTASLLEVQVSAASATFDSTVAATTVDVDATATFVRIDTIPPSIPNAPDLFTIDDTGFKDNDDITKNCNISNDLITYVPSSNLNDGDYELIFKIINLEQPLIKKFYFESLKPKKTNNTTIYTLLEKLNYSGAVDYI